MVLNGTRRGRVERFDRRSGLGVVVEQEPTGGGAPRSHGFHSTAVRDGSRDIEVGREVSFVVVPGRRGRWEATLVEPVGAPGPGLSRPAGTPPTPA